MKTQLFTKKRALISSVAMLLVAIIALGTATFAWFTKSSSASADGIKVQTVKASELKVASSKSGYLDSINYAFTETLKPATSADGKSWFTADAADKSSYDAADGDATEITVVDDAAACTNGTTTTHNPANGYVFREQLNIKNAGKAAVNNVKINFTLSETAANTANAKYLRLAIVPVTAKGDMTTAAEKFSNDTAGKEQVFANTNDTADAFKNAAKDPETITAKAAGSGASVNVGTLNADQEAFYCIFVWFEGQDEDCYDAEAGNMMPSNLKFTISGDTVQA